MSALSQSTSSNSSSGAAQAISTLSTPDIFAGSVITADMAIAACSKASSLELPIPRTPMSASCGKCSQRLLSMSRKQTALMVFLEAVHDFDDRRFVHVRPLLVSIGDGETVSFTDIRTIQRVHFGGNSCGGVRISGRNRDDDFIRGKTMYRLHRGEQGESGSKTIVNENYGAVSEIRWIRIPAQLTQAAFHFFFCAGDAVLHRFRPQSQNRDQFPIQPHRAIKGDRSVSRFRAPGQDRKS